MRVAMNRAAHRIVLVLTVAIIAVFVAVSIRIYFERPLYYNRFGWNPLQTLFPRWERDLPVRDRSGTTVLFDKRLNHALIYRPSPGTEYTAVPAGERLLDGHMVIVAIGPNEIRFEARNRLVVLDDTPRVVKSVPLDQADAGETVLIQEAAER